MLSTQDAAALLGMAVKEITAVVETSEGPVVVTHDGTKTLIRPDGELVFTLPAKNGRPAGAGSLELSEESAGEATLTAAEAAAWLGMAEREVIGVHAAPGGNIVVTHDGTSTLIFDDGELVFGAEAIRAGLGSEQEDAEGEAEAEDDGKGGTGAGGGDTGDKVPEGSIEVVLAWVGEDKERAAAALEAERAQAKPRSGLLAKLEPLAGVA